MSSNRLYRHLDHDFYGKDYLRLIKQSHLRIAISKLRLGSHNFMVERGRWTRPKTLHTHRLCKTCDTLEDEMHMQDPGELEGLFLNNKSSLWIILPLVLLRANP